MWGGGQRAGSSVCQAHAKRRLIQSDTLSEQTLTHTRATFPRCADTAIGNTHFSSNAQERGGEERRLSFNKKRVHISQHSNTKVAFPENH